MKLLPLFIFLSLSLSLLAQRTEGRVEILDAARGSQSTFVLKGGVELFSFAPEQGWYKVRKRCFVRAQDIEGKLVNPGTVLRTAQGDSLGYTLVEIKAVEVKKHEGFRSEDQYEIVLQGYLFKTKLEDGSIPELELTRILGLKNRSELDRDLESFKRNFNLEERDFDGGLSAWALRPTDRQIGDNDFRLILLYRGGNLFGVLTNDQIVEMPKVKAEWEDGDFKAQYFYKPTAAQQAEIENNIVYAFLAL